MKRINICLCLLMLGVSVRAQVWSLAKAKAWYGKQGWLVGSNYTPAYAVNQLEFWQKQTFDLAAIDREFALAESIGMNCMRVYLHHVAWKQDPQGFKKRISDFLGIAVKHRIKVMFVFFDDCWTDTYIAGKQPLPRPGVHNSGWLKDPGNRIQTEGKLMDTLERYVKDVLRSFRYDPRVLLWDLYNEPGQFEQHSKSMPLLVNVFKWARSVGVSQPLSAGVHDDNERDLTEFQIRNSDIITYHSYDKPEVHQRRIDSLMKVSGGRPMICTEYMARKRGSTFAAILPMLKKQNIGAINWGLVDGKTQTKYAWDEKNWGTGEPALWFHDIFKKDGSPYLLEEMILIKELSSGK